MILWLIISLKPHDTLGQRTSRTATLDIFLPPEMFHLPTHSDSKNLINWNLQTVGNHIYSNIKIETEIYSFIFTLLGKILPFYKAVQVTKALFIPSVKPQQSIKQNNLYVSKTNTIYYKGSSTYDFSKSHTWYLGVSFNLPRSSCLAKS